MFKYILAGLFILTLSGLLQHPVPILENVEVHSERLFSKTSKQNATEVKENHLPQAKLEAAQPEIVDHQPIEAKSPQDYVVSQTY